MELTKREKQILVLAISLAIEKETQALESLRRQVRQLDMSKAISERTKYVEELSQLRGRLNGLSV